MEITGQNRILKAVNLRKSYHYRCASFQHEDSLQKTENRTEQYPLLIIMSGRLLTYGTDGISTLLPHKTVLYIITVVLT
jgi:hypothetical protein